MNAFETVADTQRVWASKQKEKRIAERSAQRLVVQSDADAPMKPSAQEQEQIDQSKQMKVYRAWVKERRAALATGPHDKDIAGLLQLMDSLTVESVPALVAFVKQAAWLRRADAHTRHEVLALVSHALIRLRKKLGLAPFDDALFDEPPLAFEQIRKEITGVGSFA